MHTHTRLLEETCEAFGSTHLSIKRPRNDSASIRAKRGMQALGIHRAIEESVKRRSGGLAITDESRDLRSRIQCDASSTNLQRAFKQEGVSNMVPARHTRGKEPKTTTSNKLAAVRGQVQGWR